MKTTSQPIKVVGPSGQIQAILDKPESVNHDYISVNCHPHSLHGGTMTNKVIHTVAKAITGFGIPSLRFNFRGVGESAGEYDKGIGEQEDVKAVVDWMRQEYPQAKLILTGFSFGSFVSAFSSKSLKPDLLISVAPPIKRFDFDNFARPKCDWTVIMGDQDELVNYNDVSDWVNEFELAPTFIRIDEASHFFHGKLIELRTLVEDTLNKHLNAETKHLNADS
jgi:alpha/beta superfamily hydrolase